MKTGTSKTFYINRQLLDRFELLSARLRLRGVRLPSLSSIVNDYLEQKIKELEHEHGFEFVND